MRALARAFNTMSARLSTIDSQRRSFLADVAHELRTPLSIMRGRLEAMLDGIHPRDDDHLARHSRARRSLERLVGDVATVARPKREGCRCTSSRSISRCSRTPSQRTSPRPRARRRGDPRAGGADATPLTADPARIRQALANLVANALRYGRRRSDRDHDRPRAGGHRPHRPRRRPGHLSELLQHVLERFVRGPDSRAAVSDCRSSPTSRRRTADPRPLRAHLAKERRSRWSSPRVRDGTPYAWLVTGSGSGWSTLEEICTI